MIRQTMELVAEHGAAVVALTIDEEGQADRGEEGGDRRSRSPTSPVTGASTQLLILIETSCTLHDLHRPGGVPQGRHRDHRGYLRPLKQKHPHVQTTSRFRTSRSR